MTMNQAQAPETEFVRRLRAELKRVVAERGAAQVAQTATGAGSPLSAWRRPGLRLGFAAAAVTAVAGLALVVSAGGGNTPIAFAVESQPEGKITVEIRSLNDPKGLEDALDGVGIPTSVSYLATGMACREPRFRPAPGVEGDHALISAPIDGDGPLVFSVSRDAVGPGQTLVITAWPRQGALLGGAQMKVAEGVVAPCDPVPAEDSNPAG
jgi:hypothetical protein